LNINDYIADAEYLMHSSVIIGAYHLNIDRKTEHVVFISGKVRLRDGSVLDFKEFIEETETGIEKHKYGYNYRRGSDVLFRYDNAPDPGARGLASFPHHKHTESGELTESGTVELGDVLEEIERLILDNIS
jgi:hypothetical protein